MNMRTFVVRKRRPEMNMLGFFSGIGGFELGFERAGFTVKSVCEIQPILQSSARWKHWPSVPNLGDIQCLLAGSPAKTFPHAGGGDGLDGSRSRLWYDYLRVIAAVRPGWIVIENSWDLRFKGLETILRQLTALGYDSECGTVYPLVPLVPEHIRERIWIISYAHEVYGQARMGFRSDDTGTILEVRNRARQGVWLESTRPPPGVADGLSDRVDKRERIEGIGNAVVPQIPELIARRIRECIS